VTPHPDQPNTLFILVDQLRAAALPLYGEKQIDTPHLDRLAAEGMTFDHAVSPCPICGPARSILMTGKLPSTNGYVANFYNPLPGGRSLAHCFNEAGYRTAWIGKWHLYSTPGGSEDIDEEELVPPGEARMGIGHWRGYNFHLKYFDGFYNENDRKARWEGYETEGLAGLAESFITGCGDAPFLCVLAPHQPHFTHRTFAPEQYYRRLGPDLRPPHAVMGDDPRHAASMYRHYLAMTLALDDMVGRLMRMLEATGRSQDTLLIFTSDHGTEAGAHYPMGWRKMRPYDTSVRVPLIARLPGSIPAGLRSDQPISLLDWMPTLCSAAGAQPAEDAQGADLWDAMRAAPRGDEPDDCLLANYVGALNDCTDGLEWRAVRTRSHCYVHWRDGREELYDLVRDPWQFYNDRDNPESRCLLNTLRRRLNELLDRHDDAFAPGSQYAGCMDGRDITRTPSRLNLTRYRAPTD
jgi:arylsulfatase A-like enzyme